MEKEHNNSEDKKEEKKITTTKPRKPKKKKLVGEVVVAFTVRKKTYLAGDKFSTDCEFTYNRLIDIKKIK